MSAPDEDDSGSKAASLALEGQTIHERYEILDSLAQRRHVHHDHLEPIVEVSPETAFLDQEPTDARSQGRLGMLRMITPDSARRSRSPSGSALGKDTSVLAPLGAPVADRGGKILHARVRCSYVIRSSFGQTPSRLLE